jgi:hypothetical protein
MLDEGGVDYGAITGIGLMIASAVVLLCVFSLFNSARPANTAIALESAASGVCGDIQTVAAMAIPYKAERYYGFDGMDVSISTDHVTASAGNITYARPLPCRIVPGKYLHNGTVIWNDTADMREYLNSSFNATGTRESPVDNGPELRRLFESAGRSTLLLPVQVASGRPLFIEKTFVYTLNGSSGSREVEPYVLVYQG